MDTEKILYSIRKIGKKHHNTIEVSEDTNTINITLIGDYYMDDGYRNYGYITILFNIKIEKDNECFTIIPLIKDTTTDELLDCVEERKNKIPNKILKKVIENIKIEEPKLYDFVTKMIYCLPLEYIDSTEWYMPVNISKELKHLYDELSVVLVENNLTEC